MAHLPTNTDILKEVHAGREALVNHTADDHRVAEAQSLVNEEVQASLASLHEWREQLPDMIRTIFAEELKNFFKVTGLNAKSVIVTTATIIGAIVVIGGGAKAMLGWLGFSMMK